MSDRATNEFGILDLAAGAMAAQRGALEALSRNVAAASVCGPEGYARYVPTVTLEGDRPRLTVRTEHHDAESGLTELLAVMDAQHGYEADASLFAVGKRLVERTLDVERA